ncbi:MAG: 50S ribosomal protein L6 [Candidatus Micrarchaeota archaeon]
MNIPDGITLEVKGSELVVKGKKGEVKRSFPVLGLKMSVEGTNFKVESHDLSMVRTVEAHLANMAKGVTEGFSQEMQVIYSHFPVNVEVKGKQVLIKNFIGEKQHRFASIIGSTKVEVSGQKVVVSGINLEDVGQTIANIGKATKIRNRDSRVFQDGIYTV